MITQSDLERWKHTSLETAIELGHDVALLDKMRDSKVASVGISSDRPANMLVWYGYCLHGMDPASVAIRVLPKNISNGSYEQIAYGLHFLGIPRESIASIREHLEQIPPNAFPELFNQSGMDHELIGHGYNYLKGLAHDERDAVAMQLELAALRAETSEHWRIIRNVMAPVLGYLKNIEELKH